jgi:large subunit ribosomal protein L6
MSKIGKKPITIPDSVEAKLDAGILEFKKGEKTVNLKVLPYIKAELSGKSLSFSPENTSKQARANWGTIRSLANNAVAGLSDGFSKILEIEGVGYRAVMEGETLVLNIGLSHPVKFAAPEGVKIEVNKNAITVSGIGKAAVGQAAAKIRAFKKVEPYKGKGIKYKGETVRRKAGKKVTATK